MASIKIAQLRNLIHVLPINRTNKFATVRTTTELSPLSFSVNSRCTVPSTLFPLHRSSNTLSLLFRVFPTVSHDTTATVATGAIATPNFIKFTALLLASLSCSFLTRHLFFSTAPTATTITFSIPFQLQWNVSTSPPPPRLSVTAVVRTGIVDEVGEFMGSVDELNNLIGEMGMKMTLRNKTRRIKRGKYVVCVEKMRNLSPVWTMTRRKMKHCPEKGFDCLEKGFDCLIPVSEAFKSRRGVVQ